MSTLGIKYPIIIYPCPEGGFVMEVPSLPGCMAQGETVEESFRELAIVIDLWIETAQRNGQVVPLPDAAVEKMRAWSLAG